MDPTKIQNAYLVGTALGTLVGSFVTYKFFSWSLRIRLAYMFRHIHACRFSKQDALAITYGFLGDETAARKMVDKLDLNWDKQ